jgi:hypothetical protein
MNMLPSTSTQPVEVPEASGHPTVLGAGFDFTDPRSPLAPYYLRASHVAAVAFLSLVFLLINYARLWHTDIWGHLKFGQWMIDHGRLPARDPLCPFATETAGFLHYSWLSQTALYLVYHLGEVVAGGGPLERMAGGVALLRFVHALVVLLRYLILFLAFRRVSGSAALASVALVLLAVFGLGSLAVLRPQVFGELGFACVLLALSRPRLSRRALLLIPLIMVLWANAHASFAAGLVLLAAAAAGRALEVLGCLTSWRPSSWRIRELPRDPALRRLAVALCLSVLAVAVLNPNGPRIYIETVQMASHPNVLAMDEWQPLSFTLSGGAQWAFLGSLVLLAGTRLLSKQRFSPSVFLFVFVFAGQSLLRQRMLLWWLTLVPWIAVRYWPACLERLGDRFQLSPGIPSFRKTLTAGTLVILALVWSCPGQWLLGGQPPALEQALSLATPWRQTYQLAQGKNADARGVPALQTVLNAGYPQGRFTGCVFASETLGDLVLWDLAPDVPVFVYSHVHLFSPQHWERCRAVRSGSAAALKILTQYHVNLVLVEPDFNLRLCARLRQDPAWKVLVDERDDPGKADPRYRLFVAVRKVPL